MTAKDEVFSLSTKNISVTVVDDVQTGKHARTLRKSSRLTMTFVAKKLGISTPYLCDLEYGRRHWSPDLVREFVKAIKTTGEDE